MCAETINGKRWIHINCTNERKRSAPSVDHKWEVHAGINMERLLRADSYDIRQNDIDMSADAYLIINLCIETIERDIALAKDVRKRGAKVVVAFSSDFRFIQGDSLINSKQTMYTELTEHADVILSGMSERCMLFGRHQDKVIYCGCPLERLNMSTKTFEERNIDLLVSGKHGEQGRAFAFEICYMIKQKFPDINITYCAFPYGQADWTVKFRHYMNFVEDKLVNVLPRAKAYACFELRPTCGRPAMEAFYFRTPAIFNALAYHSRLFPDFVYDNLNMQYIVDLYAKMRDSNYHEVIQKAEQLAEYDYFDNFYQRLEKRLWG